MRSNPWEMFRALSVETRLKIFEILKTEGPLGVKRLAELVGVTPAAVSQHLKILKQAGLVRNERHGYYIPYSIDEEAVEDCCGVMLRVCSCQWPRRPHRHHNRRMKEDNDLESLKEYEKQIEKELNTVRKKIEAIKQRSK
jgi:DNA-binding transcriptional ArsR family regulator